MSLRPEYFGNYVNTVAADVLDHCVIKSLTAMIMTMEESFSASAKYLRNDRKYKYTILHVNM